MPELPEVETVRSYLDDVVKGRKIVSVDVLLPRLIKNRNADEFAASLTGCTFTKITRKGKYLFLHLNANSGILAHLRLTGRFLYEDDDGKDLPRFSRIVFHLDKGRLIYGDIRTLGCLWIVPDGAVTGIKGYDTLGPDGISPDLRHNTCGTISIVAKRVSRPSSWTRLALPASVTSTSTKHSSWRGYVLPDAVIR